MLNKEYETVKNKDGITEAIAPNPYLKMTQEKESIYYQDGEFYAGSDLPALDWKDVPDWTWNILRVNYTQETRDKFSIKLPEQRKLTDEDNRVFAERKANAPWTCDECGETVKWNQRNTHIATHAGDRARAIKKEEKQRKFNGGGTNATNNHKQTANG